MARRWRSAWCSRRDCRRHSAPRPPPIPGGCAPCSPVSGCHRCPDRLDATALLARMGLDKKADAAGIRFILWTGPAAAGSPATCPGRSCWTCSGLSRQRDRRNAAATIPPMRLLTATTARRPRGAALRLPADAPARPPRRLDARARETGQIGGKSTVPARTVPRPAGRRSPRYRDSAGQQIKRASSDVSRRAPPRVDLLAVRTHLLHGASGHRWQDDPTTELLYRRTAAGARHATMNRNTRADAPPAGAPSALGSAPCSAGAIPFRPPRTRSHERRP